MKSYTRNGTYQKMPFGNRLWYVQRDSPVHRDTTPTAQIWSNLKHKSIYITGLSSTTWIKSVTLCKESIGYEPLVQQGKDMKSTGPHWLENVRFIQIAQQIMPLRLFNRQHQGTTSVGISIFGDAHLFQPCIDRPVASRPTWTPNQEEQHNNEIIGIATCRASSSL